jgi:hypothetical protein
VAGKATGAIGNVASKAGGLVSKGAGLLGKAGPGLLKGLGAVGRVAGKFAAPLAIGMAAYDAYKGWNADPNATTGQKFKNAGRNILSGLTFGLVDSTQDKMDKGEYTGTQVAPPGAEGAAPAGAPVQGAIAGGAAQRITNPTAATPAGKPEQPGFFSRHKGALMGAALGPVGVLGGMAYDKFFGNNQVKSGQNNDSGMLAAGSEEARDKMNINVPPPTVISNSTGADANKTSPLPTSPITVRDDDSSWMRFTLKRAMA